ncbi:MAG: HAD family phosphatase [Ruminococcaceae bacterium]|nr:HAD family phosphatase [Oscillospiraceae bacterium]
MSDYPSLKDLRTNGVKLLIFDLDGTLLDSMNVWNKVDIDFLGRYGYEVTPEYTDVVKRVSVDEAALYTQQRYKIPLSPAEIMAEWDRMVSGFYKNEVELKPNVRPYLDEAKRLGFQLGVATALTRNNAVSALVKNNILGMFEAVITLEDVGKKIDKSSPDIFLKVLNYVNARGTSTEPSRTLVYDDVQAAARGAKSGGFLTCAVYDKIGCGDPLKWESFAAECDYSVREF